MYVLDRFEEGHAVLEDTVTLEAAVYDKKIIPPEARAGDVLCLDASGVFFVDRDETELRKERIRSKFDSLKKIT